MNYIIKNSKSWVEYMVVAWWMHLVPHLKGQVLLIGAFNNDAIEYISQYCHELHVLNADDNNKHNTKVKYINSLQTTNVKYDAIIIDTIKQPFTLENSYLSEMLNNYLGMNGVVCYLENNNYSLNSKNKSIFKKIINIFSDLRITEINQLSKPIKIDKLPTIYYDNEPYESFIEGSYFSNKNTFLLKEKIRRFIFNSRLSRLFVSSNIWLIAKNKSTSFFHTGLLEFVADKLEIKYSKYIIASILYKRGKLIFTYVNNRNKLDTLIAIITYEEEAYNQRLNEMSAIEYLSKISVISKFVSNNYFKFDFCGYMLFTMKGSAGVTVDAYASNLDVMTSNIFDILVELSANTLTVINSKSDVIQQWLHILNDRSPCDIELHDEIYSFLQQLNLDFSVFMHGDAKIENFVLDKNNNVSGIIDFEQSIIQGFPLIDIFYLIVYNYQIKYQCDFSEAFASLVNSNIQKYEAEMIEKYSSQFKLDVEKQKQLLVLFFVHHYSCRYHTDYKDKDDYSKYRRSLHVVLDLINGVKK